MLDFIARLAAPGRAEAFAPSCDARPTDEEDLNTDNENVPSPFEGMQFRFPLRKYQQEILELTRRKLERGERALHIVAPPGAGKTIIGLQIVCELKEPALIISPTTTIQAQWGEKLGLFLPPDCAETSTEHLIGTHEDKPLKPITLLTYQVLSTTSREQEYLEKLAHQAWVQELVSGTANSMGGAELRILELLQNNKKAYDKEISRHVTRLRRKLTHVLDLKEVLHPNALSLIQALRRQKFKVVIFDECHHLTDYWAAIMGQVVKRLDAPLVIGLTGTPPEGKSAGQETRYMSLVGDIDYQVPTPALVREGGLAPFQDLVLFTRPTPTEEQFLELQHHAFHDLVVELTHEADIGAGEKFTRPKATPLGVTSKIAKEEPENERVIQPPADDTREIEAPPHNRREHSEKRFNSKNLQPGRDHVLEPAAPTAVVEPGHLERDEEQDLVIDFDSSTGDDFADELEALYSTDAVHVSTTDDATEDSTPLEPSSRTDATECKVFGGENSFVKSSGPCNDDASNTSKVTKKTGSGRTSRTEKQSGSAKNRPQPVCQEPSQTGGKSASSAHKSAGQIQESSLLTRWVTERLAGASAENWDKFLLQEGKLCAAMCRYSWKFKLKLPEEVELSNDLMQAPLFIDDWMWILEDFSLNYLKLSASVENHQLYERIRQAIAKLGYGLTEKGLRKQASPVDRVLAFSRSKSKAVAEILQIEYKTLGERLRAVVVTDFEKMSATATRSVKGILSEESGGAIAVMKDLLADSISEQVNPCLVTGSLILIDNRIAELFQQGINELLAEEGYGFKTTLEAVAGEEFSQLNSSSAEWESRIYVGLATCLLARGVSKVLVGTRGIFGEGWDCQSLNTLVDLTTTTTPMSVKQLRGRSIRINTSDPLGACKVANNWDVVCIAPHLEKGLNDYQRFVRKHDGFFGVCDDGQIECGVGHVHPSFSELTPAEVFAGSSAFNTEMKERAAHRANIYQQWKVGEHYSNVTIGCVEIADMKQLHLTPPYLRKSLPYADHARLLQANLSGVGVDFFVAGAVPVVATAVAALIFHWNVLLCCIPAVLMLILAVRRYCNLYQRLKLETCQPCTRESGLTSIGIAILRALQKQKIIPRIVPATAVRVTTRSNGSLRVFLDTADPKDAQEFVKCVKEVIEPIKAQLYLLPKFEYMAETTRRSGKTSLNTDSKTKQGSKEKRTSQTNGPGKTKSAPSPKTPAKRVLPTSTASGSKKKIPPVKNQAGTVGRSSSLTLAITAHLSNFACAGGNFIQTLIYDTADWLNSPYKFGKDKEAKLQYSIESTFFKSYLKTEAELRFNGYYVVPSIFSKSQKGRQDFQQCWNKYVSPGEIFAAATKQDVVRKYFGKGAIVSRRMIWE